MGDRWFSMDIVTDSYDSTANRCKRWMYGLYTRAGLHRSTGRWILSSDSNSLIWRQLSATATLWPVKKRPGWSWKYLAGCPTVPRLWLTGRTITTSWANCTHPFYWWWPFGLSSSSSNQWRSSSGCPSAECPGTNGPCFKRTNQSSFPLFLIVDIQSLFPLHPTKTQHCNLFPIFPYPTWIWTSRHVATQGMFHE